MRLQMHLHGHVEETQENRPSNFMLGYRQYCKPAKFSYVISNFDIKINICLPLYVIFHFIDVILMWKALYFRNYDKC